MRAFIATISALFAMAAQTQAMDWDTLSVNAKPVPPQATVSFSIGYPKGWQAIQDYSQGWHDIYNGNVVAPPNPGPICSFGQPTTTNTLKKQRFTSYVVWSSQGATAKEAAETFFNDKPSAAAYTQKSIKPVKTSAGDSGWLVESKGYFNYRPPDPAFLKNAKASGLKVTLVEINEPCQKVPIIFHDYFFHSGKLGAIHIQIMTEAANASWRSQLDRLVLRTLRFTAFNGFSSPL